MASVSQAEIDKSTKQSTSSIMLRVWEEVSKLFIAFLRKSEHSSFKKVESLFVSKEYQQSSRNISHTHLILEVLWDLLTIEQRIFVEDLIRASLFDIVCSDEIEKFVEDGIFYKKKNVHDVFDDANAFLTHHCNSRCLMKRT